MKRNDIEDNIIFQGIIIGIVMIAIVTLLAFIVCGGSIKGDETQTLAAQTDPPHAKIIIVDETDSGDYYFVINADDNTAWTVIKDDKDDKTFYVEQVYTKDGNPLIMKSVQKKE